MKRLIFGLYSLLLILAVPVIRADSENCIEDALENLLYEGGLISQTNGDFQRAGLLVQGGGLCGPTCAYNLFQAVEQTVKNAGVSFSPQASRELSLLYHEMRRATDIRQGMDPRDFDRYLRRAFGSSPGYSVSHNSGSMGDVIWKGSLMPLPGEAKIFSFAAYAPGSTVPQWAHYVLVKSADRERMTMELVDPNFPDRRVSASFAPSWNPRTGKQTFRVQLSNAHAYNKDPYRPLSFYVEDVHTVALPLHRNVDPNSVTGGLKVEELEGKRIRCEFTGDKPGEGTLFRVRERPHYGDSVGWTLYVGEGGGASQSIHLSEVKKVEVVDELGPEVMSVTGGLAPEAFKGKQVNLLPRRRGYIKEEGLVSDVTWEKGIGYVLSYKPKGSVFTTTVELDGLEKISVVE